MTFFAFPSSAAVSLAGLLVVLLTSTVASAWEIDGEIEPPIIPSEWTTDVIQSRCDIKGTAPRIAGPFLAYKDPVGRLVIGAVTDANLSLDTLALEKVQHFDITAASSYYNTAAHLIVWMKTAAGVQERVYRYQSGWSLLNVSTAGMLSDGAQVCVYAKRVDGFALYPGHYTVRRCFVPGHDQANYFRFRVGAGGSIQMFAHHDDSGRVEGLAIQNMARGEDILVQDAGGVLAVELFNQQLIGADARFAGIGLASSFLPHSTQVIYRDPFTDNAVSLRVDHQQIAYDQAWKTGPFPETLDFLVLSDDSVTGVAVDASGRVSVQDRHHRNDWSREVLIRFDGQVAVNARAAARLHLNYTQNYRDYVAARTAVELSSQTIALVNVQLTRSLSSLWPHATVEATVSGCSEQ